LLNEYIFDPVFGLKYAKYIFPSLINICCINHCSSATNCGIEVLANDAFSIVDRLKTLALADNKIKRLEAKTFKGMLLLQTM